ncbi:MAG: hypothetical protein M3296_03160 [Actinomycetota bacterium]|nr:hypothetical protein [Actinomycetota bacterium]
MHRSGSTTATRFKPADHDPANVPADMLAVTGACMYVKGHDRAWCLRAWHAGLQVVDCPTIPLAFVLWRTGDSEDACAPLVDSTTFTSGYSTSSA